MKTLNETAARWWADRFKLAGRREEFHKELLTLLNLNPKWKELYNDYDPSDELLLAMQNIGLACKRCMYSGDGLFPRKTGIFRVSGITG